jgi:transcriptional regulator with XRE-family HTH domain
MQITEKLGKRLKLIRVAAGIKQKVLASNLNIPAPLLSMYENGSREPSLSFLDSFATFFGLPLSQIFTFIDNDETSTADSDIPANNVDLSAYMSEMKQILLKLENYTLKNR